MNRLQDPTASARALLDELGLDAIAEAGLRAEACRQDGDSEGVRYWNTVSRNVRLLAVGPIDDEAGVDGASSVTSGVLWRLMQRVEHFRHRAAQCRRKANEGSDVSRTELLEMEQHWLELAAYAEALANGG